MIYQNYIKGFVLLIVAVIAFKILVIPLTLITLLLLIVKLQFLGILTYINRVAEGIAICIDIMANVLFGYSFNKILAKNTENREMYKFGKIETISRVLGKNKERNSLTKTGKFVSNLLHLIDKDHVEKAAK